MIRICFHGATGTVTGSMYLITVNNTQLLVDCGVFQGPRELRLRNWEKLPFDPAKLKAVIVTHAHIDHIGYLPRLAAQGFSGPVYATPPTADIAVVQLTDSAKLQEEDAAYRNKKGLTRHKKALPLFTTEDAQSVLKMFQKVSFNSWHNLASGIRFRCHIAGHVLGAASIELELDDGEKKVSVLFSGDIGRYAIPLIIDPAEPPAVDYLICESTYGGHIHPPEDPFFKMAEILDDIIERKSILLIPAFSVGRTQQIIYMVNTLIRQKRIESIDIHVDSPMAVKATDIYRRYKKYHNLNPAQLKAKSGFLSGKNVHLHRKRKASKQLNKLKGPVIILSSSGMMTGGRIMHHLINRLPDPTTTLALAGFMARGTLGRKISEGDKLVYIHKRPIEVNAKTIRLHGLSGHADFYELEHWLENMPTPRKVFLTHGEPDETIAMGNYLKEKKGWHCDIPRMDQSIELT